MKYDGQASYPSAPHYSSHGGPAVHGGGVAHASGPVIHPNTFQPAHGDFQLSPGFSPTPHPSNGGFQGRDTKIGLMSECIFFTIGLNDEMT